LNAHINADPFLFGSTLQGDNFGRTIAWLNQYVNQLPIDSIPDNVKTLVESCNKLVEYHTRIKTLNADSELTLLALDIHQDIKNLKKGEYLLMPGGWTNDKGGHAIIYQYSIDDNGDLLFTIDNSGSGLNFHEKKSDPEKELYNPMLIYKIPANQINNESLAEFIQETIIPKAPQLKKMYKQEPNNLYEKVFPKLAYVKGGIIQSNEVKTDHWYTGGQLSGTCAQRSLHQMLKCRFDNLDEYRRFIYDFKMYTLKAYANQPGVMNDPKQHDLIEKSIRHNLRLLNVDQSDNPGTCLFSIDKKSNDHNTLLALLTQLNQSPKTDYEASITPLSEDEIPDRVMGMNQPNPPTNSTPPSAEPPNRLFQPERIKRVTPKPAAQRSPTHVISTTHHFSLTTPTHVIPGKASDLPLEDVAPPIALTEGENILEHMDKVLKRCESLQNNQYFALLEQLETFFLNLPLPETSLAEPLINAYSAIDSEERAFDFCQKINQLQMLYFDACQKIAHEQAILPRMYLVKMSIFSAVGHVSKNWILTEDWYFYGQPVHGYHLFVEQMLYPLSESPNQAWIANNDPLRDARYKHICTLHTNKDPKDYHHSLYANKAKMHLFYYIELFNAATKNTDLKTVLEKKYEDDFNQQLESCSSIYVEKFLKSERASLQENNLIALYYFMNHVDELQSDEQFKSLLNKFKLQLEMEKAYTYGSAFCSLNKYPLYFDIKKIRIDPNRFEVKESPAHSNFNEMYISTTLMGNKYDLKQKATACAQLGSVYKAEGTRTDRFYRAKIRRWSDNSVQLEPRLLTMDAGNHPADSTSTEERELFHLRRDAASQIRVTLDYFNLHLERCARPEIQAYIEANLFQPGLLSAELTPETAASFFDQLDAFVTNGLAFYEKNARLSQPSLFFIRLTCQVNLFAAMFDSPGLSDRLELFYQQLNHYLMATNNPTIKTSLHRYRFLTAVAQMKIYPENTAHLNDALLSYVQMQIIHNPGEHLDADMTFQLQCAKHDMMRYLRKHQDKITHLQLHDIFKSLGISVDASELSGQYPVYEINRNGRVDYTINIERGLVFNQDNMAYTQTPLDIQSHPVIKQLGLQGLYSCFVSTDGKTFLINKPPVELRFIKEGSTYHIQKKWADNAGEQAWFQLAALTNAQRQAFQLDLGDTLTAPDQQPLALAETITERDSLAWVHCDKNELLITDSKHQPWYRGTMVSPTEDWQLTDVQKQAILCAQDTWIHQHLEPFEATKFITVAQKGNDYVATLARYGLQFKIDAHSKSIQMDWEGGQYDLQDTKTSTLGEGIAHLLFKQDKHAICVLPVQPFINTKQRDKKSAYNRFEPDTQAKIPHQIIEKTRSRETPQLWQYTDTEQCFVLKINSKGEPVPKNSAEALFLCYVYLGNNQPEKAWAVLDDCDKRLGGLEGTYDELRYLSWIIKALPHVIDDKDEKAQISNPPFVACKLKALALLTAVSKQDKKFVFPEPQDKGGVNATYERQTIKEVSEFYTNLNKDIYKLFTQLQAMRREMPVKFTLSDMACKQLLEFYHDHIPGKVLGALGYEWVRLNFTTLRQEYTHLIAKERAGLKLSAFDAKRKQDIDHFIKNHNDVAKHESHLEYGTINLSLDNEALKLFGISGQSLATIKKETIFSNLNTLKTDRPMRDLSMSITDDLFIQHFNAYLSIAITTEHPSREALLTFCEGTLIASRHVSLAEQLSNVPLLCNILYRVLKSGQELPYNVVGYYGGFEALLKYAKTLPAPDIVGIPQLVDTTTGLLTTAQDLWDKIPEPSPKIIPEILDHALDIKSFDQIRPNSIKTIAKQWRAATFQENSNDNNDEFIVGENKYQALVNLKSIANTALDNKIILPLTVHIKNTLLTLTQSQDLLSQAILKLAQKGPQDPIMKQRWDIDEAADKRAPLDMTQLLTLYFHQDTARYKTETGLSDSAIKELHTLLANYVSQGLCEQQCQRVQTQLERYGKAKTSADRERAKFLLAQDLFAENRVDVVDDPVLSLFQFYENKLLRPEQKTVLDRLLTPSSDQTFFNSIEKIIMGGGKSKVIIPTLAQKKVTGNNLVMFAVPRALLRTNFTDLKATSNTLFNQTAYPFEFNRDSDCSPKRLEQIYNDLTDVMVNKNYLVTTVAALQSLELKYFELLSARPKSKNDPTIHTWENQVLWADKLVSLIKNRGDLVIDEVHQELLLNNKLNFVVGELGAIPRFMVEGSIDTYQFFKHVKLDHTNVSSDVELSLEDALRDNTLLADHPEAMERLAQALVHHEQSPLQLYVKTIGGKDSSAAAMLTLYLQNKGPHTPDFVLSASPDDQKKLAFYKTQISHFLPNTLKRNYGEHYGPSKSITHSPETKVLAIPYLANNVPNERSRFENCIETSNYTTQSLLIDGVDNNLLHRILKEWQIQAQKELNEHALASIDDTPTALTFNQLPIEPQISFSELDLEDEAQLSILHQSLQHHMPLIYEALQNHVLKNIATDPCVLGSNSINLVDEVNSCQGMSGTPSNYSTFHQDLHYDLAAAMGTDGYIYAGIKAKAPTLRGLDFNGTEAFIEALLANYKAPDQLRAIIDISATFKNIGNETVARSLAQYIHQHPEQFNTPKPLQYLLYFNADNQLSAIRIGEDIASQTPIVIGPSDPVSIKDRLGCDHDECFSFYDQSHTVGADLKQSDQARGLVLVDSDTTLDSFLQGAMRMRGLIEGEQQLDIIVPKRLANQSLEALVVEMEQNQKRQLQHDNFEAAQLKMINSVRADLKRRILDIHGADAANKKADLFALFKSYFIKDQVDNFFNQYGQLTQEQDTKDILNALKKHLLDDWVKLVSSAGQIPSNDEYQAITDKIGNIVRKACEPGVCAPTQMSSGVPLGMQVEVQQQAKADVLVRMDVIKEIYDATLEDEPHLSPLSYASSALDYKPLASICETSGSNYTPEFSPNIIASKNFYQTYKNQNKYIGSHLKPVHALLFKREHGKLSCTLLSQQENQELSSWVKNQEPGTCWISTTQHHVLAGTPPSNFCEMDQYQAIIEQVRYFNGEFNLLLQKDAPLAWLDQQSEEKLAFFEAYLSVSREALPLDIDSMRNKLMTLNCKMTAKHPKSNQGSFSFSNAKKTMQKMHENEQDHQIPRTSRPNSP